MAKKPTVTGRMSATEPIFRYLGVPGPDGKAKMYPRELLLVPSGYIFCQADYSGTEMRLHSLLTDELKIK